MGAISPRCKRKDAKLEAVRALSNLSSNQEIKRKIVEAGALGYLISMSKSGAGLTKMYALATLTNLEHDTAALRIQMAFRGFQGRRAFLKKKKKLQEEQRKAQAKKKGGRGSSRRGMGSGGGGGGGGAAKAAPPQRGEGKQAEEKQ